jgi:hypothetical protein
MCVLPGAVRVWNISSARSSPTTPVIRASRDVAGGEEVDRLGELFAAVGQCADELDFVEDDRGRGEAERVEGDADQHDAPQPSHEVHSERRGVRCPRALEGHGGSDAQGGRPWRPRGRRRPRAR